MAKSTTFKGAAKPFGKSGHFDESMRHSLQAKGIKTGNLAQPMLLPVPKSKLINPKTTNTYTAYGEVYNVKERLEDAGMPTADIDPDWYEYEVTLEDKDGHEIDRWDSYSETYNGVQTLSKKTAERAMTEILDDVEKGKAANWFSLKQEAKR